MDPNSFKYKFDNKLKLIKAIMKKQKNISRFQS